MAPRQCGIYASQDRRTGDLFAWEFMNETLSARRRRLPSLHQLRAFEAEGRASPQAVQERDFAKFRA
jgi:hypothetical protein